MLQELARTGDDQAAVHVRHDSDRGWEMLKNLFADLSAGGHVLGRSESAPWWRRTSRSAIVTQSFAAGVLA